MTQFKSIKRRKNNRQYVWEYMRRNRVFKVEDLQTVVDDMSEQSMKDFFKQLEHAGYIKVRKPKGQKTTPKLFKSRTYGFIKNTGVLCPVWIPKQNRLYDRNTQQLQLKDVSMKLPVEVKKRGKLDPVDTLEYDRGRIMQILDAEDSEVLFEELQERSGVPYEGFMIAISKMKDQKQIVMRGTFVRKEVKSVS